jgi:Right handed beta helix region
MCRICAMLVGLSLAIVAAASAEDASRPAAEPVLEEPTLHCLGVYWVIAGDDNGNATVAVDCRRTGAAKWLSAQPLFRVERGAEKPPDRQPVLTVAPGTWLFAGSLLFLQPDTEYEVRLSLSDPDGGPTERVLRARTIAEPQVSAQAPRYHVVPGGGGGSGTQADPYRGLAEAQAHAKAADVFLLHAGAYEGTFTAQVSGEPGKPIVWIGAGDGEAAIDGQGSAPKRPGRGVSASGIHDVWFERLTIRNADYALVAHDSSRLVIRRCHMHNVEYGITFTSNERDQTRGFFIADNTIEGPSTWPRTKGIENARGIQATGAGHVICYNRVRGFADAIDTFPSGRCEAIDIHNNEISEMTDDGIEMDYSYRNTRCFLNRLTNVFQGISTQPVYGGPVYIVRNAMYNVGLETFKMHNSPSGALMLHNTCVKTGVPLVLWTGEQVRNCRYRNNLFIGTEGNYAYETTAPMVDCDFDYDGFGGGPWGQFLKWNSTRYATLEAVRANAPVYRHAVTVGAGSVFATGVAAPADETVQCPLTVNDLRLRPGTAAIDAGEVLPGVNDAYSGKAPDLGAYELGGELPHYGPRPE